MAGVALEVIEVSKLAVLKMIVEVAHFTDSFVDILKERNLASLFLFLHLLFLCSVQAVLADESVLLVGGEEGEGDLLRRRLLLRLLGLALVSGVEGHLNLTDRAKLFLHDWRFFLGWRSHQIELNFGNTGDEFVVEFEQLLGHLLLGGWTLTGLLDLLDVHGEATTLLEGTTLLHSHIRRESE